MKNRKIILGLLLFLIAFLFFLSSSALASEKKYIEEWCKRNKGTTSYFVDDGSSVDCLTEEYAVEFESAKKWPAAVGWALYYSTKTDKKPGIVLIIKEKEDYAYLKKLLNISEAYDIKVWTIPQVIFVP
jgi:hypothetical protein